jgi:hypothetical protein
MVTVLHSYTIELSVIKLILKEGIRSMILISLSDDDTITCISLCTHIGHHNLYI